MAVYVMLSRFKAQGYEQLKSSPASWQKVKESLAQWEAKVLHDYYTLGKFDRCTIFEAPDNFHAYRASLAQEVADVASTQISPAIDLPLFARLVEQTTETEGPHHWQIRWWAKVGRVALRWHAYSRWVKAACKPLTVHGRRHLQRLDGPCVVIANHQSHMDSLVVFAAMPERIKWNLYFGAAADRWFIKRPEASWDRQPWYQSLAMGTYPIHRGGGSKTLDYPKWLVDQGCNLMIFPEGTRSTSKQLNRFRYGVALLALEKNIPVVPVYMTGLKEMRPKGSKEIVPGPADAYILPPLHFAPGTSVPDATQQMFIAMDAMHQRYLRKELPHGQPHEDSPGMVIAAT